MSGGGTNLVGKRKYANYYSGTDIRIYFGDKWVDEIVEIEWSMQEQVAPIFGFSSYTWDRVARGNRIVQGSFSINFKEAGYLQTIMNSLSSQMTSEDVWFNPSGFNLGKDSSGGGNKQKTSVEKLIKNFADLADGYENAIWGSNSSKESIKTLEARKKDSFFNSVQANPQNKALKDHGFNILLTFGNTGDTSRGAASPITTQSIVGVQLTGVSQRIDPSGNPIAEVYTFIAKDVSGNVNQAY